MLHRIQAAYRYLKAEKARSDALVEEGRQIMGWHHRPVQTPRPTSAPSNRPTHHLSFSLTGNTDATS
jgi:hypothetical protein